MRSLARILAFSVVLVSTHDASDWGELVARSGARGFLAKADLSGDALDTLLAAPH